MREFLLLEKLERLFFDGWLQAPAVMFTKEEVLSFITAEKLMQKFSHQSLGNHYQMAMEKVRSVLRHSDKNLIQNIENRSMFSVFMVIPEIH
jgi:predicted DNA-binding transcriptional regulator YafY